MATATAAMRSDGRSVSRRLGPAITVAIVAGAAIAARGVLYRDIPALLGADSWDYLRAAGDIRRHADFFSAGLRDVRLPGYATLLAVTHPLTGLRSDAIVLLQIGLGLAAVAVGWGIGVVVRSRVVSVAMAAFLALDPAYLLNEHAVLTESFAVLLYAAIVLVGLARLERPSEWRSGLLLGVLLGVTILTRANVLALGTVIALGACVVEQPVRTRTAGRIAALGGRLRRGLVPLALAFVVLVPWLCRNYVAYGNARLYASADSNVLLYKNMHTPLDLSLPTLAGVNDALGHHWVDFEWQQRLQAKFPPAKAERLARRILREQVAAHPWRHVADIAGSLAGFVGFSPDTGDERSAMRWWFANLVTNIRAMNRLATDHPNAIAITGLDFLPAAGDTRVTRAFARVGYLWLCPGRAIVFLLCVGMLAAYAAWSLGGRGRQRATRWPAVAVLTAAYLGTVAMHGAMVVDYDRYSTGFDFVVVLIGALVVDDALAARRGRVIDARTVRSLRTASAAPSERDAAVPRTML